eukprot:3274217-Pyramimonas_sp.AAC.1
MCYALPAAFSAPGASAALGRAAQRHPGAGGPHEASHRPVGAPDIGDQRGHRTGWWPRPRRRPL